MTKVTIDAARQVTLPTLCETIEFCDPAGKTVGHYLPEDEYRKLLYARARELFSDEEIERRRQKPISGRTLRDIWARLGRPCDSP